MSLPLRLSGEIPRLLAEHPEGLTFDQLVDLSIASGIAAWEANNMGRHQVESDMVSTLGLAASSVHPAVKDPKTLQRWKESTGKYDVVRMYHFLDWEYRDGKYVLQGNVLPEIPERITLVNQLSQYAMKRGLTNTQYLRMFIPVCINDVIAEAKKSR